MSLIMTLQREGDFLRATISGEFLLAQAKKNFVEILGVATEHNCQRVLFDGRDVTGYLDGPDRFFYGEFAAHTLWDHIARGLMKRPPAFAFVLAPPVLDPQRFGMTVAQNRGMRVKAFDNVEEALQWLGLDPLSSRGELETVREPPTS